MTKIKIQTLLDASIEECFSESLNGENLDKTIDMLEGINLERREKSQMKIGTKREVTYSALKEYLHGKTIMTISELIEPYRFAEYWKGGFIKEMKYICYFEQKGDKVLMTSEIDYEVNTPIFKNYIDKKYINPTIRNYLNNRMKIIKNKCKK